MVYLSANVTAFDRLLKTLYWVKEGVYPQINHSMGAVDWTLQEVLLAADDMRSLLSESRMLRNEDMVKETGHASQAVYDSLSSTYDWTMKRVNELQQCLILQSGIQAIKQSKALQPVQLIIRFPVSLQ